MNDTIIRPPELPSGLPESAYEVVPGALLTFARGNKYSHHSFEEILARRLNSWKGWHCAAGRDGLYINPDGNVFAATCRTGGVLANVYEGPLELNECFITCDKDWCMCGSDAQLRKARDEKTLRESYQPLIGERVTEVSNPELVLPHPYAANWQFPVLIIWDIGRRCNYSCSYCNPKISNQYEAHKSEGSLRYAVDNICDHFLKERRAKFVFTGGEPTLNSAYLELVKYLRSRGHMVHTQSNGSRLPEYFAELIDYSLIGLSLHMESAIDEKFIQVCQAVVNRKATSEEAARNWFGVKIMVKPGHFDRAFSLLNRLREIPNFSQHGLASMSVLYEKDSLSQLQPYKADELAKILENCR